VNETGRTMGLEHLRFCAGSRMGIVALCIGAMASSPVAAAEPSGSSVVVVDVDASIERAELVRTRIAADADAVLKEHDVATTIDPKAPRTLTIDVGGQRYAYEIELVVERSGEADEPLRLSCECNYDELFAKVQAGVRESVPALQRATTTPSEPVSPPTNGGKKPPPGVPDREGPAPLGALGKAGIATLVIGVAGLGSGIGLAVVGERERAGSSERGGETTNFGPPGYALIGIGAAAVITGAVLIAVDRKRARKRSTSFTPWVGPGLAGLSFGRRF
jgi:hypothetical protein